VLARSSNTFLNPRVWRKMVAYDVASTVHQSLPVATPLYGTALVRKSGALFSPRMSTFAASPEMFQSAA